MTYPAMQLEVLNGPSYPKENSALEKEVSAMSDRLEETTDYTEEDEFLVSAINGDYHGDYTAKSMKWYDSVLRAWSEDFPHLIFSMDFTDADSEEIAFRWYFQNGKKQEVIPYVVVPDFDASEAT